MPQATIPCVFCGIPTTFRVAGKCNNCYEVIERLEDFLKSSTERQHVMAQLLIGDLAPAVIEMDNVAFGEGLAPETPDQHDAWGTLLGVAETVAGKRADSTNHRLYRESLKDAN